SFVFPMVVGPRYVPTGGYVRPGERGQPSEPGPPPPGTQAVVRGAGRLTPLVALPGTRPGHDISLTVHLDAGLPVAPVRSVPHSGFIREEAPARRLVRLEEHDAIPNRDFILQWRVAGDAIQSGLVAHAAHGRGYLSLVLQPPAAPSQAEVSPKEMVFVID